MLTRPDAEALRLVWPAREFLPGYVDALARGWSPDTLDPEAGFRELTAIHADADGFLASLVDRDPHGKSITLPAVVDRRSPLRIKERREEMTGICVSTDVETDDLIPGRTPCRA